MAKQSDKPWERQPGESEKAFEAFKIYRDMGLKRSNQAVCDELSKSRQLITRWKSNYNWDERARAYDNEIDKQAHQEAVKNLKDMTNRHIKISIQLQKKAMEAMAILKPEEMTPKDIKEFVKMATELERLNRTMAANQEESVDENDQTRTEIYLPEKEADDG